MAPWLASTLFVARLAQVSGPTPAFGAARPAECGVSEGARASNPWERAKLPQLRRYCEALARGTAHLVSSPALVDDVLGLASEADKLLPSRAAPKVLEGRALLRLGRAEEAVAALSEAKKRDDRALDDPVALLAWARANARTGHLERAAEAYRAALPRTSALTASERSAASFEAGMSVMAAEGRKGADDAVAMLRQARRDAHDSLELVTVVALALALDRAGQREESRVVLAERIREGGKPSFADRRTLDSLAAAGVAHELDALVATAIEAVDAAGARDAWRRYLEGPGGKGPWAEHARAREAALGGGAKKRERLRERGERPTGSGGAR